MFLRRLTSVCWTYQPACALIALLGPNQPAAAAPSAPSALRRGFVSDTSVGTPAYVLLLGVLERYITSAASGARRFSIWTCCSYGRTVGF